MKYSCKVNIVLSLSKIFTFFLLLSCGAEDFDEQSELKDLRILGIKADRPEINSAGNVVFTPLISYPQGGGKTLEYTWEACPDPGVDFGSEMNCNLASAEFTLRGSGNFNTNTLSASLFTGNSADITLNIAPAFFIYLNTLDEEVKYNGLDYILFLTFKDLDSGQSVKGLKRVKLSTRPTSELNTNPSFSSVIFNNSVLTSFPSEGGVFTLGGLSPNESYEVKAQGELQSFQESPYVSWYTTSGDFLFYRTEITETNEFTFSSTGGVIVVIYRDGRGGLASRVLAP